MTRYKDVPCPTCKGRGFNTVFVSEKTLYPGFTVCHEVCKTCSGRGYLQEPMANGDLIRSLSNDDLVDFLYDAQYMFSGKGRGEIRKWLSQEHDMSLERYVKN